MRYTNLRFTYLLTTSWISTASEQPNFLFYLFICPECTKTNNSEQIVEQDSKATQDALITARIISLMKTTCERIKIHLVYLPNKTIPMMFSIANIVEHKNRK